MSLAPTDQDQMNDFARRRAMGLIPTNPVGGTDDAATAQAMQAQPMQAQPAQEAPQQQQPGLAPTAQGQPQQQQQAQPSLASTPVPNSPLPMAPSTQPQLEQLRTQMKDHIPAASMNDPRIAEQQHHGWRKAADIAGAIAIGAGTFNPMAGIGAYRQFSEGPLRRFNTGIAAAQQNDAKQEENLQAQQLASYQEANTNHMNAETQLLQQNNPMRLEGLKLQEELSKYWKENPGISNDQFMNYAHQQQQLSPGGRFLNDSMLQQITSMPRAIPYTVNKQDDIPVSVQYQGHNVGPKDPGWASLPPEARAEFDRSAGAHTQKNQEIIDKEGRVQANAMDRMNKQNELRIQAEHQKGVDKAVTTARMTDMSAQTADEILNHIGKTGEISGPEAMTLLSLHVATTFGGIPGVRVGEALIQAHMKARSLPEDLEALYNRIKAGGAISVGQAQEWNHLIHNRQLENWNKARDEAERTGVDLKLNFGGDGLPTGQRSIVQPKQNGGATDNYPDGSTRTNKRTGAKQTKVNGVWQ